MTPWDDATNEFDDVDDDDLSSDEFNESEDERAALRGTSQCDGLCDPQCDWCLVAHYCPDECAGGPCPYDALEAESKECETREGLGHNNYDPCADCHGTGAFPP